MARKKRRTAAQRRATARMIAAAKRRRRSTRKGQVRKTARRAYETRSRKVPRRRYAIARRSGGELSKKGLPMKLGAAAVGAIAAQALPFVGNRVVQNVPITYGAVLGVFMIMRGKKMWKWVGFGMVLGGGVLEVIQGAIGPALEDLGQAGGRS